MSKTQKITLGVLGLLLVVITVTNLSGTWSLGRIISTDSAHKTDIGMCQSFHYAQNTRGATVNLGLCEDLSKKDCKIRGYESKWTPGICPK